MLNASPSFLIVDDDHVTCKLVEKLVLQLYPHSNVNKYTDSESALESLMKYKYDICILDYNIDEINGRELLEEAMKLQKIEGAVMMSDMKTQTFILDTLRQGFNDFVVKPIHKNEFRDCVTRVWKEVVLKREVHKNYKKYVDMISSLPDIVYKIDENLIIRYVNHAVSVLGYSPKELIGKPITYIIHEEDVITHSRDYAIRNLNNVPLNDLGHPLLIDERRTGERLTKNLSIRLISKACRASENSDVYFATGDINSAGFLDDENGVCSIGVIRDITTYQKDIAELEKKKMLASQELKAKSDFLSNMSHELRTPMNGILAASNLILHNNPNEENKELAELIFHSTKSLIDIINDILCFSKLEAGGITIREDYVNLQRLIQDIYDLFIYQIDKEKVDFIIPQFPPKYNYLLGDPVRLRQILMNLIGNAFKFTEKGHIKIEIEIEEKNLPDLLVTYRVIDTGIGIPKDKIKSIFSRYTQVDSELNRSHIGTGLGLAISEKLTKLMNGEIHVESKEGEGSEFRFSIPMKLSGDAPKVDKRQDAIISYSDKKILIVDDNKINLKVLRKILVHFDVSVTQANSGKEAVELCQDNRFDLIFMDIQMPEMDGLEATSQIKQNLDNDATVIAITANVLDETKNKCLEVGMKDVLFKPICIDDIRTAFEEYLS